MKNMTCLVTGGESGLGRSFAAAMAREGAELALVCRDAERAAATRLQLIRETGNPNIDLFQCDFSSLRSVRRLAGEVKCQYGQLDLMAHMSGITFPVRNTTPEGLEANLAYNLVSPFLLTGELTPLLFASAPAQVLVVTGESHRTGRVNPEEIRREKSFATYLAHQQSSLARMIWAMELARRLEDSKVTVHAFCPGNPRWFFLDQISQNLPFALPFADWRSRRIFDQAVIPIAQRVVEGDLERGTGRYFVEGKDCAPIPVAQDPRLGMQLWNVLEQLSGAYPFVDQLLENIMEDLEF